MVRRTTGATLALGVLLAAGCSAGPATTGEREPAPESVSPLRVGDSQKKDAQKEEARAPADVAPELARTPRRPRSPREAAAQITAAERAVADPDTRARTLRAAGHAQQLAYRAVADRPGWDARVASLLPRDLRPVTRANVAARRAFRSMHPRRTADLATELPAWRVVAPLPAAELRALYRTAERRYGIEWEYLAAINLVETAFGRIAGTSVAGAQGPMQFIPTTWDIYGRGGDVRDPRDAIMAAARLLRANGFDRDRDEALRRYNNHSAYVRGVTLYAEEMKRRPRAYLGYHAWPVYYLTRFGSVWLPEGYDERRPVPVREWRRRNR